MRNCNTEAAMRFGASKRQLNIALCNKEIKRIISKSLCRNALFEFESQICDKYVCARSYLFIKRRDVASQS
jgi:hypothetical protein